jgi:hypothetical protein
MSLVDARAHLRAAWLVVALFVALGIGLEAMLGLRIGGWADAPIRRELVRLGHAHGALGGLLNVGLAWTLERLHTPSGWAGRIRVAALVGGLLVGVGFVGGGAWHGPTDPGPLVLLVPAGALMLLAAVVATACVRGADQNNAS